MEVRVRAIRQMMALVCWFGIWADQAVGQSMIVADSATGKPIADCYLIDEAQQYLITGKDGRVDLARLDSGWISIRHFGYAWRRQPKAKLLQKDTLWLPRLSWATEQVVISASRWEQEAATVPSQLVQISQADIAAQQPLTAAEMLANAGVFVQKSQQGGGSPMLRGFAANSVLIALDGTRVNNAIFRSGNLHNIILIDPLMLGQAEVYYGAGAVMYGSDALGGVMDFHTISPQIANSKAWRLQKATFLTRYHSANDGKTFHGSCRMAKGKFGWVGAATYQQFGDLRAGKWYMSGHTGWGEQPWEVVSTPDADRVIANPNPSRQLGSGYDQLNLMQKLRWQIAPHTMLTWSSYWASTNAMPRYDRLAERHDGLPRFATWAYTPQDWHWQSLTLEQQQSRGPYSQLRAKITWQQYYEGRRDRRLYDDWLRQRTETVRALAFNLDAEKIFESTDLDLFYGLEWVGNQVASDAFAQHIRTREQRPIATRYPDGGSQWQSLAAYLATKWLPNPRWALSGGIRFSKIRLQSSLADTTFYPFPFDRIALSLPSANGHVGAIYRTANGHWRLKSQLSTGFRAPNVDDVGKVFDSAPGLVIVPNPGLRPEKTYGAALTTEHTPSTALRWSITAYLTWLSDAMIRQNFTLDGQDSIWYDGQLSQVQALTNTGRGLISGISAELRWQPHPRWQLLGRAQWQRGRDLTEQQPLRHVPPAFGQIGVRYTRHRWSLRFELPWSAGIPFGQLAPSEQEKPQLYSPSGAQPWLAMHLRAEAQLTRQFTIMAGAENLTDLYYRTYSSGIGAPGRSVYFTIRYDWQHPHEK